MTEQLIGPDQFGPEELNQKAEDLIRELDSIEDGIADIQDAPVSSRAIQFGLEYLLKRLELSQVHATLESFDARPMRGMTCQDVFEYLNIIVHSARQGNYNPAKKYLRQVAFDNKSLGFEANKAGNQATGEDFFRLSQGYEYISEGLPSMYTSPFHEGMLRTS